MKLNKIRCNIPIVTNQPISLNWILAALLCLLSSGCQQSLKLETGDVITKDNVTKMIEVAKFRAKPDQPIAALVISPDGQNLILSQAGEQGIIQKWALLEQKRLNEIVTNPVSVAGTAFDLNGQLLGLTAGKTDLTAGTALSTDLSGVMVIDTETGLANLEFGYGYGGVRRPEGDFLSDVVFSPDRRLLIAIDGGIVNFFDIIEEKNLVGTAQNGNVATFNKTGSKVALATANGFISLYRLKLEANSEIKIDRSYDLDTVAGFPLTLAFSPDDQWLAHLGQNHLTFFNLQEIEMVHEKATTAGAKYDDEADIEEYRKLYLSLIEQLEQSSVLKSIPSSLAGDLAFNPLGDLLAVGTAVGWQMWDVEQQELLIQKDAEGVYALTFSPDGRWFAWGDAQGTVHLWGVISE